MTQSELISIFARENSICDRVLLITPPLLRQLLGVSVHECRVFLLVAEGEVTVQIGNECINVCDDVLVDMLVWEPVTFSGFSENVKAWCLLPNYIFTNEALNGLKPADSESFKDRHEFPMLHLEKKHTRQLQRHLEMLGEALGDFDNFYRLELCQTYFRSFMLEAGNLVQHKRLAMEKTAEIVESRQDAILRTFLKLVWRYYKTEHNVDFYAERLYITSKHLSKVVKNRMGKTPYAVIRDELIQNASEQLKTTKRSIQEISADLHFSEMAAFCKFFKKNVGMTPSAYRAANSTL